MLRSGPTFQRRVRRRRPSQVERTTDLRHDADETATLDKLLDLFVPVLKSRPDRAPYLVDVPTPSHDEAEPGEVTDASETSRVGCIERVTVVGEERAGEYGRISPHQSFHRFEIEQGVWCEDQVVFQDDAGLIRPAWVGLQEQIVQHTTIVVRHVQPAMSLKLHARQSDRCVAGFVQSLEQRPPVQGLVRRRVVCRQRVERDPLELGLQRAAVSVTVDVYVVLTHTTHTVAPLLPTYLAQ